MLLKTWFKYSLKEEKKPNEIPRLSISNKSDSQINIIFIAIVLKTVCHMRSLKGKYWILHFISTITIGPCEKHTVVIGLFSCCYFVIVQGGPPAESIFQKYQKCNGCLIWRFCAILWNRCSFFQQLPSSILCINTLEWMFLFVLIFPIKFKPVQMH